MKLLGFLMMAVGCFWIGFDSVEPTVQLPATLMEEGEIASGGGTVTSITVSPPQGPSH